tara:strand:- start:6360 stop:6596 length:237 start_codon:yes stop_codon:yes gene_type:complete
MFNSKNEPKKVEAAEDFVAKASEELEEAVAEEIEVEDPTVEEAAAVIEELTEEVAEEEVAEEAVAEDTPPVRHRGPQA